MQRHRRFHTPTRLGAGLRVVGTNEGFTLSRELGGVDRSVRITDQLVLCCSSFPQDHRNAVAFLRNSGMPLTNGLGFLGQLRPGLVRLIEAC
jgi:hypothetical protein